MIQRFYSGCSLFAIAAVLGALNTPAPANAQTQTRGTGMMEEIQVTARKRGPESLNDIPISVSALGTETLQNLRVDDFDDFALQVPSLSFIDGGAGEKRIIVRGVNSAGQQQVGLYFDEAALPGMNTSTSNSGQFTPDLRLYDVQRIEVLRGPQGTAFGANSQTGTIRIITNKPKLDVWEGGVHGQLSTTESGGANWQVDGMINVPVIENKLGLRAVVYDDDFSGFIENTRLDDPDVNDAQTTGARIRMRYQPTEWMTIDGMYWHQNQDVSGDFDYFPTLGDLQQNKFTDEPQPDEIDLFTGTATLDLDFAEAVITGSVFDRFHGERRDSTPIILFLGVTPPDEVATTPADELVRPDLAPALTDQAETLDSSMVEARLSSTHGGPVQWLSGFFWRKRFSDFQSFVPVTDESGAVIDAPNPTGFIEGAPGEGIPGCNPCVFAREAETEIEEIAAFGEASYDFEEQFDIPMEFLVGLRWFKVDTTNTGRELFPFALFAGAGSGPGGEAAPASSDEDQIIKKFNLSYRFTDDKLGYFTFSEGFRLGGTNQGGIVDIPVGFESDEITNYELGAKTTWLDGRLQFNAAAFWMIWDNLQVDGDDPTGAFSFTSNAGEAEIIGAEIEVTANPLPGLTVNGGLTFLPKRELTEDQVTEEFQAPGRAGDTLPQVAEWQGSGLIRYERGLGGAWSDFFGFGQLEITWLGERTNALNENFNDFARNDSFILVDMSAGLINDVLGGTVSIFVENLSNNRTVLNQVFDPPAPTARVTSRPRTVGLELRKTF